MSTVMLRFQATTDMSYRFGPIAYVSASPRFSQARLAENFGRSIYLDNDKLLRLADRSRPPQSWYDEDFDGLF